MLQCVAVCCSVLQCVAVFCSVLQCVAVYCSVLQCVLQEAARCNVGVRIAFVVTNSQKSALERIYIVNLAAS